MVAEAMYSHSGEKKKLNFDHNRFKEFKNKIIYLPIENEPDHLVYEINSNNEKIENDLNFSCWDLSL